MKKKLLLIVSMLAVTFMFAGCGSEEDTLFEYDEVEIAQFAQDMCENYQSYSQDEVIYNYVTEKGEDIGISEGEISAVEAFRNIADECGEFEAFTGEYSIEENDDSVLVTLYATCADYEAEITVTCIDNSALYDYYMYTYQTYYGYDEETAAEYVSSSGIYKYTVDEVEIAANLTFAEKMKAAGTNTLIGMCTVFVILIFISFIISLLKYVPMIFDKETRQARKAEKEAKEAKESAEEKPDVKKEEAVKPQKTENIVDIVNSDTGESVTDDGALVAVITAAVAAYSEGNGQAAFVNYPSNDKLIAHKIRRIKR